MKPANKKIWFFTILLIIIAGTWITYWFLYLQFHESTDDAYANGYMVTINTIVPGSVTAFYADNTDLAVEGGLLAKLDETNYQIKYERELAALRSVVLEVKQLIDTIQVNLANVESKKVAFSKARFDYENRLGLIDILAVSKEDFVHSRDDLKIAEKALKQAKKQLKVSRDAVGNYSLENHPRVEERKMRVRSAYYDLQHCSVFTPITGYVAQRSVTVGESVNAGKDLMTLIPAHDMWVDANFKETQLRYMRVGQPARVWFDLYGSDIVFDGIVIGIASGSGSVFSLIPPQNATGNWIKIVQRLPVRIGLDPEILKKYPLRLGISATVDVDISDTNLPYLREMPREKPVATTNVFTIDFSPIDKIIDEIIRKQEP